MSEVLIGFGDLDFLRLLHNMIVHFPLTIMAFLTFEEVYFSIRKKYVFLSEQGSITVYILQSLLFTSAVLSGLLTVNRSGFLLDEPTWIEKVGTPARFLILHRTMGIFICISFLVLTIFKVRKSLNGWIPPVVTTTLLILMGLSAHLGAMFERW